MTELFNSTFFNYIFTPLKEVAHEVVETLSLIFNLELIEYLEENISLKGFLKYFLFDDFQIKLLKGFLLIFFCNVILIFFTWRIYGKRISNRFMKTASNKAIEDLKKSVSMLKLPTEHTPRFKKAGPGYRLDETPSQSIHSTKSNSSDYQPLPNRSGLTQESKQAAAAALARLDKKKNDSPFNTSIAAIKAQVKREMEAERKAANTAAKPPEQPRTIPEVELESTPLLAVQGVYFRCPLLGPEILTREEWNQKIREFLYEQLSEEKGLTACLILHSLNKSKEKVDACIETISKYFENILKNPSEEKYRKIRLSNKVYQEKVKPLEGASLLLEAAGFEIKHLPYQEQEEDFLVFPIERLADAPETFEILLDGLKNAEPITLELHRNLQVLLPSQAKERSELPSSFFNLTVEELKREQMLRTEAVERNQMLRTKAMRERDEIREIRKYKFALIRIRFPDGIYLQGTFGVYEKIASIVEFVREALEDENLEFTLTTPGGQHLTENSETTLFDEKLVPAAILTFTARVSRQTFLKPEVLMLVESLTLS